MTGVEFAEQYARRSGASVDDLRARGRGVFPCDCGDDTCQGWQMVNAAEYLEDHPGAVDALAAGPKVTA